MFRHFENFWIFDYRKLLDFWFTRGEDWYTWGKLKFYWPSKILQDLIFLTWVMGLVTSGSKTITWTNVDKNLKQITASLRHNGLRQLFVWSHKYLQMFTGLASETRRRTTCMTDHGCGPKRHYRQVSNIRCTYVCNKIVDHSDVVGASPFGAAPTTSSFST